MNKTRLYLAGMTAIVIASGIAAQAEKLSKKDEPLIFNDAQAQTEQFIRYNKTIKLSATQRKIKAKVLGSIPAPCCKEYSIATCCCPCNLAKTVWGLANHAIARLDYDAAETRALVLEWMQATNPAGYSGDSCHRGGCPKRFSANGCGGMKQDSVVF